MVQKKFLDFFGSGSYFSVAFLRVCRWHLVFCIHARFVYALLTSIVEVGVWFIRGFVSFPVDALFIGRRGKRLLVAMVTKGEVYLVVALVVG